jgi:AbrB family looped-hinge helix DNA binding protein
LSRLTRKGQITVPMEIRRRLGLDRGDVVAFEQDGDLVTIRPATAVATRTAGALRRYAKTPPATPEQERAAFAEAVAGEAGRDS